MGFAAFLTTVGVLILSVAFMIECFIIAKFIETVWNGVLLCAQFTFGTIITIIGGVTYYNCWAINLRYSYEGMRQEVKSLITERTVLEQQLRRVERESQERLEGLQKEIKVVQKESNLLMDIPDHFFLNQMKTRNLGEVND